MNVGERIKQRRLELGLSQDELARRMGLSSRSAVCQAERSRGEQMTPKTLAMYARALNCRPSYLMGNTDDPTPADKIILTDDEQILINLYRNASDRDRELLRRMLAYAGGLNNEN